MQQVCMDGIIITHVLYIPHVTRLSTVAAAARPFSSRGGPEGSLVPLQLRVEQLQKGLAAVGGQHTLERVPL